jgi:hypothetical protein
MPTSAIATYSRKRVMPLTQPHEAQEEAIALMPSQTLVAGTLVGQVAASVDRYAAYNSTLTNGAQTPTHILEYDVVVDASGNISIGDQTAGERGQTQKAIPAWVSGTFSCADLTGLDANAVTTMKARLTHGTVSDGRVVIPG